MLAVPFVFGTPASSFDTLDAFVGLFRMPFTMLDPNTGLLFTKSGAGKLSSWKAHLTFLFTRRTGPLFLHENLASDPHEIDPDTSGPAERSESQLESTRDRLREGSGGPSADPVVV